ncbi:MAG: dehydrogenase E1 component subunit alpha/beta, partial [Deltaproteobacteria bacterium]|nr:dehydrogenase E1 component subunit alpha/beta [Deltaproteobacteria bacterium]
GTNIVGMISPLGSMNSVAAGIAWAEQLMGQDSVVLAYIGDGGTSTGAFHEAINFIGARGLPVITVIENNQWAYGTPNDQQFGCEMLAHRGIGYGMPGLRVDGTDLAAMYEATREAVERARAGGGPTLIESLTMRMRGHAEHDDQHYVPQSVLEAWAKRDPVDQFLAWLRDGNRLPGVDVDAMKAEIDEAVLASVDNARHAPEPGLETALLGLYEGDGGEDLPIPDNGSNVSLAPSPGQIAERARAHSVEVRSRPGADSKVTPVPEPGSPATYLEAIRECVRWRMKEDARVVALGEDVGGMGGAFRVTEGFLAEFGDQRVVDMPISEMAIVGSAIGLALRGLRPVAEMQFSDFVASGFNELVNNAATFRYRIGCGIPMVVRLPSAGGVGAGPFHSLNPEGWFAATPGLKIVIPATVEDAWGLMNTAIDDGDPVLFLEQKYFYRRLKGSLPPRDHRTPLGKARVAREGSDITVVTWGLGVERCTEAADRLGDEADVEIIDLRSIVPWDKEAVAASVRKTSRLLVMHEARRTLGFGAEIAAWASEHLFEWLDAPVKRVAAEDIPIPSNKGLERAVTPQVDDVHLALEDLLAW